MQRSEHSGHHAHLETGIRELAIQGLVNVLLASKSTHATPYQPQQPET
jgi:hypothetical protein